MQKRYTTTIDTPVGKLVAVSDGTNLLNLSFAGDKVPANNRGTEDCSMIFDTVNQQIEAYFNGQRKVFDVTLVFEGTPFQQKVWSAMCAIPYGETVSYKEIAQRIGTPKAVRAVGTAVGRNPFCVIGPCHRVVGSNGSLGGYAGGLPAKQFLLKLENADLEK